MKNLKFLLITLLSLPLSFASCGDDDEQKEVIFYEVGDLYQEGNQKAVIYKVVTISGGMYALAVSFDEAELAWSTENVKTGATDLKSGTRNQEIIQKISDWETKYPAFKWCADKNQDAVGGWYLPSAAEMREIYSFSLEDKKTGKVVSLGEYIEERGGVPFSSANGYLLPPYWTSTESFDDSAATIYYSEYEGTSFLKNDKYKVRAVKYIRIY